MNWYVTESLALAALFEAVTLVGRFGFKQAAKAWTWNRPFGLRIHHGYWAPLLWLGAWLYPHEPYAKYAIMLGNALLVSDIAHHCLLKLLTGSFEF